MVDLGTQEILVPAELLHEVEGHLRVTTPLLVQDHQRRAVRLTQISELPRVFQVSDRQRRQVLGFGVNGREILVLDPAGYLK